MSTFATQTDGASVQKAATDDTAVRPFNAAPSNTSEQLPAPEKATMKPLGQAKAAAEVTQEPIQGPNAQASVKLRRKPHQTQEELSQKLEEFQKQKERKKEEEAKSKRPPFRVGDYKGFGRFEPGNFYFQLNKGRISLWKISFKNTSCR